MADDRNVVRGINWRETFPFTRIFRSFRIAIHPTNLLLALAALFLIYVGGWVLDRIWPISHQAIPNEIGLYFKSKTDADVTRPFSQVRRDQMEQSERSYKSYLESIKGSSWGDVQRHLKAERDKQVNLAWDAFKAEKAEAEKERDVSKASTDANIKDNADKNFDRRMERAERTRKERILQVHNEARMDYDRLRSMRPAGNFESFYGHQVGCVNQVARGVRTGNWLGSGGVFEGVFAFFVIGPSWAFSQHPVFFTLFFAWFFAIWAIFGGAICRIAAVQATRDEKIAVRQAFSFAIDKFVSFFSAPLIPLIAIVIIGLIIALLGLVASLLPWLGGQIIFAALFFIVLIAAFGISIILLGLAGGYNLMYPTIAVEGSDSFDAISRSYSYLYGRPWRLAFYTLVAVIYGGLTYAFVRFFIYLMLAVAHAFAGFWFVGSIGSGEPLWNSLWAGPIALGRLTYDVDYLSLTWAQGVAAWFLSLWVHLVASLLGAYAISFYFSANTIIYLLMRKEVDSTELDDVYLEESEDEFVEQPLVPSQPAGTPASGTSDGAPAGGTGA